MRNKCSVRLRKPFDSGSLRMNRKIAQAKKPKKKQNIYGTCVRICEYLNSLEHPYVAVRNSDFFRL